MTGPTPRQLDILAAYWRCGLSNVKAGELLDLDPQIVRNQLWAFRREAGAPDNQELVRRYFHLIAERQPRLTKHHVRAA